MPKNDKKYVLVEMHNFINKDWIECVMTERMYMYTVQPIWNLENNIFQQRDLDLWPVTLTFKLIPDIVMANTSIKFRVYTSDTHTGETDFIHVPWTADVGGNDTQA